MGRAPSLDYDEFAAAAATIVAAGKKLTFASAREQLGGRGSYQVLRRYIDQFLATAADPGAGTGIPPLLQALANQARDEALREAREELAADAEALEADREALAEERAELQADLARADAAAAELRRQLEAMALEREALMARVDLERRRAEELSAQLAASIAAQQAVQRSHDLVIRESANQARELADRFARDLAAAQARFDGLQQHTLRMVDELRVNHVAAVTDVVRSGMSNVAGQVDRLVEGVERLTTETHDVADRVLRQLQQPNRPAGSRRSAARPASAARRRAGRTP